jgi:zinc transporter
MTEGHELTYGTEPGVRFTCLLDGRGGSTELSLEELRDWRPGQGSLWIHLERNDERCRHWLREESGLDPMVVEALLVEESHPRVEDFDDALLVIMRGVNRNEKEEPVDLVPLHLWIDTDRVISLRDKDHFLTALREIREALAAGHGPHNTGALFGQIAEKLVKHLEPLVDELEDQIDELDEMLSSAPRAESRKMLSDIRRQATKLRRYIAPQREALFRLQVEDASWLGKRDKIHLREVIDRLLRYIESLDSVRDRSTLLHEDLTSLLSEQINRNSYRLTAVAAILLPPSLVAGIFGMNLGGLPGNQDPAAFTITVLILAILMPLEYWILKRIGWL